jgi:SpoVK/Ycf46/Vps4 family AAA+-type ATPase
MGRKRVFRHNHQKHSNSQKLDSETRKYIPLFGSFLVEMALTLDWYQPPSPRRWPDIFNDSDFCVMTGMTPIDDCEEEGEDDEPKRITAAQCRKLLMKQLAQLQEMKLSSSLPLFKNIDLLAELLDLTESDQAVLTFAAGLNIFPEFMKAISPRGEKTSTPSFCRLLAGLTGIKERELLRSFSQDSPLITSGLVNVDRGSCDLEDKVRIMTGLEDVMLTSHKKVDDLVARFMRRAAAPTLALDNFPHMHKDRELLGGYLGNALKEKVSGVNVLFHGKPGVGKNEFVQALAKELNIDLYEVSYTDDDGDPIKGQARLQAYALCQRLLARNQNAMLLFDEIEDVFESGGNFFSMLFGGDDDKQPDNNSIGKAWINRTLENNPVPAIWISNRVGQIDKAYLRRFDYSVSFPTPPHSVRSTIARHHLDCFDPPQAWIERLAANESIIPAQFERAAKVARIASTSDNVRAMELVEQTLDRSITLLGQRRTPSRNILRTGYSLEWLNTDIVIESLVEGVKRRPRGTFCFYGSAGTGKSELARYMSDQIGKPMILKRASDILSKWVGESEQNIARMFSEARQQNAVLLLDEADSFLSDRRDAVRSWEVTQVNELLTQMEAFEGIFICTTNLMSKLDQASLRRFAFKVRFDPLKPDQRIAMFRQELSRLGGDVTTCQEWVPLICSLGQLTPGDFAVASRQFELWDEPATPGRLYEVLKKECEAKERAPKKIGFGAA